MQMPATSPPRSLGNTLEGQPYWEAQFKVFAQSQLCRKAFCREQGLNYHRFQYWYRKLKAGPKRRVPLIAVREKEATPKLKVLCTLELHAKAKMFIHDKDVIDHIIRRWC